ncbi:molybdate ABC transporter substrate-binding protein [Thorsellia anophelis]|uniref:ABC-type molybdate transport system, substrate-binding protein n=1 Tax=Thorsellia anophelis DSM 18579 TaxID=1123402 RepID=A0A1I0BJ58_9GAMM|nr:substrate-binding domain-containing protein [Thorsellia anophelis]SET06974.1 ABC-type molybdate transport system, substrate-binding protein [Thorsellia anophelis DSM 18579]
MLKNKVFPKCHRLFVCIFTSILAFSAHSFTFTQVDIPLHKNDQNDSLKITIHASHSLKDKLTPILKEFNPPKDVDLQIIYTGSTFSAKQLELGSPIDLIISANSHDMLQLQRLNWISDITPLWENRLVLIKAPNHRKNILTKWQNWNSASKSQVDLDTIELGTNSLDTKTSNEILNFNISDAASWENLFVDKPRARIGLADPLSSALGMYTEQALSNISINPKILGQGIYYFDSQIVLSNVLDRQVDYAIVFYSDVVNELEEQVITIIPNDMHSPIIYQVAQVNREQSDLKKEMLNALTDYLSDTSVSIKMLDAGFTIALPDNTSQNNMTIPLSLMESVPSSTIEIIEQDINTVLDTDVIIDIPPHIEPISELESTENLGKENTNE